MYDSRLPIHPYLPVLVWKLARSMEVRPYFSKYRHYSFQKVRKSRRERCEFVASEADGSVLMGSYHSLTFAYFKPYLGLKYMTGPDWSKKFVKPVNIDFASKLYRS